jgi:hypothetical protein
MPYIKQGKKWQYKLLYMIRASSARKTNKPTVEAVRIMVFTTRSSSEAPPRYCRKIPTAISLVPITAREMEQNGGGDQAPHPGHEMRKSFRDFHKIKSS